jgi:integrase/recombinase XerD
MTNKLLSRPSEFSSLLQRFFVDRLSTQKNVSPATIAAYRDTFRLLLRYAEQRIGKVPSKLTLGDFNANLVLAFLDFLEKERKNSIRSRNARLAAVHSFAKYACLQCPQAMNILQQILAIPMKRFEKPLVSCLSRDEMQALLSAPDSSTWCGLRDRLLLAILYNTGARVSEVIGIRVSDVTLEGSACIRLRGKGRKQRTIPIWKSTASEIRSWLKLQSLKPDQPLLPNRDGTTMTRSNVAERLAIAVLKATRQCPQLKAHRITPHSIRHATALHLLQSGIDITVIALWLGHESPTTTHIYVEADMAMKERVLAATSPVKTKRTRFKPSDSLLSFLEKL